MASPRGSALLDLIGHKIVKVKPRGLKPYEYKFRFKGEPRFHTIPRNEKPKVCLKDSSDTTNTSKTKFVIIKCYSCIKIYK